MMVQMLGVFAEFERATIIDRVIAGMERKAARGEWCGGQRPFGYLIDKESSTLTVKEDEAALVPHIFRLYVSDRLGANAIAGYLNNEGHRTRNGRPWSHMSVLTVLRNRAYVGEVFFRGAHHASSHQPLIDPETFTAAQDLLVERGGEKAACRSNSYDYLLSRLLICTMCGKRYVGAAAHGRNGRYEYYVCFSRQRYGSAGCSADRLPARELEEAIIDLIGATYSDVSLVDQAFEAAVDRTHKVNGKLQEESHRIDAELKKTEAAIDRYLAAFEDGSMSSAQCGPRLEQLSGRLAQLQAASGGTRRSAWTATRLSGLRANCCPPWTAGFGPPSWRGTYHQGRAPRAGRFYRCGQRPAGPSSVPRTRPRFEHTQDWQPQRGSNPCLHLERVVSLAARRWGRKRPFRLPDGQGVEESRSIMLQRCTNACRGEQTRPIDHPQVETALRPAAHEARSVGRLNGFVVLDPGHPR